MERIQQEIHCPKCRNLFKKESIEVLEVKNDHVDFSSRCHICGASSHISAKMGESVLQKMKSSTLRGSVQTSFFDEPLTEDKMGAVMQRLKDFRGNDVKRLFE